MNVKFTNSADSELKDWLKSNRAVAKKIYELINDINEFGLLGGRGKPEQLKYYENPPRFSRRITKGDRLVYSLENNDDLLIISCKGHYEN